MKDIKILEKIAEKIKDVSFFDIRNPLTEIFDKKLIDFNLYPVPHYQIRHQEHTIMIINKKYVDDVEVEQGIYAIGYIN